MDLRTEYIITFILFVHFSENIIPTVFQEIPKHGFKIGQKLEAVDLMEPR